MEILLKHKRKDSWSGVTKYGATTYDYIAPLLTRSGNRHTGLTDEDARRLEGLLGLDKDVLAPWSKYWITFAVKLSNKELVLDTDRPWDELQYLFLSNHKRVANGIADTKPTADYVLINKDAEAKEANISSRKRREAAREFDKLSLDDMRKCLRILGYKPDSMSSELIENKLFEIIDKEPEQFMTKWVNNKNKNSEYMVQQAISKNIIRKSRNVYYYGTETIGSSLEDTISYLDNQSNKELKMAILNELESKK